MEFIIQLAVYYRPSGYYSASSNEYKRANCIFKSGALRESSTVHCRKFFSIYITKFKFNSEGKIILIRHNTTKFMIFVRNWLILF